jgi:GTP cyclohydrolase I/adenine phosphoribosyltransferase/phosphomevalonate kinase
MQTDRDGSVPTIEVWTEAFRGILDNIPGEDPHREGLVDTPRRAAEAIKFFTEGYQHDARSIIADAIFKSGSKEMVVVKSLDVYSLCEHHIVPFFGKVHVAYIPRDGKVVGLSKIPRIVNGFARRLQLQERLTMEIGKSLNEALEPLGVAVIVECRHLCMEMRGVECTGATTRTQFRCGVFDDALKWAEFIMSVPGLTPSLVPTESGTPSTLSTVTSTLNMADDATEPLQANHTTLAPAHPNEADDYRLYQSCSRMEFETMAEIVHESTGGPSFENREISLLDIGAGNGRLLESLAPKMNISKYVAYEANASLCAELRKGVASKLGSGTTASFILNGTFSAETNLKDTQGSADIVLLSHCLYYTESKESIVNHALKFVAPGGILFIFHRWKRGGTLATLSRSLHLAKVLHDMRVFEATLSLKALSSAERQHVLSYCKTTARDEQECISVRHGCLAIEKLDEIETSTMNRKVNFEARRKTPATVVVPQTIVGIKSCLYAASRRVLGSEKVSVVGGGHSPNCYAENAIAIDMSQWDQVEVNESAQTVRVGGGSTIGAISLECEKYGLVVPLGDRPSVGMGLVLQGGINHLMRSYGLACDNIIRVKYIAPTGEHLVAVDSDLFRFRGAGPNFGVVTEITLKAHKLGAILTRTTDYHLDTSEEKEYYALQQYSKVALNLPNSVCLDGFIYWATHDQPVFATSSFDIDEKTTSSFDMDEKNGNSNLSKTTDILPCGSYVRKIQEEATLCHPSQLFDRELYMTERFHADRAVSPGEQPPDKLRSLKRCLFFAQFDKECARAIMQVFKSAPTKWTYIHILHGGGAVRAVNPAASAFGCRDWCFAAVITGRFPDNEANIEAITALWLEKAVGILMPFSVGVYAADLGPKDSALARHAFGSNIRRLASTKRKRDPLNLFSCSCPLLGPLGDSTVALNDPVYQATGAVVVFCGRRFAGKDWLAEQVQQCLSKNGCNVSIVRISDATKRAFAAETPGIDAQKLIHDREYKETHRQSLIDYYEARKAENAAFDSQCFVDEIEHAGAGVLLLTGLRDGLSYARRLAGRPVVLVKVTARDQDRKSRGWVSDASIDESPGECSCDEKDKNFWDALYQNNVGSTSKMAMQWVQAELAPALLKRCVRSIPDTPRPGIVYKDLVGGILRQPFGSSLTTSLLSNLVEHASGGMNVDAIVVPEATGFLFAAPVAMQLQVPLIPLRKAGRTPGEVSSVEYGGSNITNLNRSGKESSSSSALELADGLIERGQRVVIVDDCLASGSTSAAIVDLFRDKGAIVKALVCVAELPELRGRNSLENLGVEVFSLMKFEGQ